MVRSDSIVEDGESIAFLGLKEPMDLSFLIFGKLEEKLSFMTPMGNVPDVSL